MFILDDSLFESESFCHKGTIATVIVRSLNLQLLTQSVPITTNVVSSTPA